MKIYSVAICLLAISVSFSNADGSIESDEQKSSFYTAAVIEMNPVQSLIDPYEIVESNLKEYLKWIQKAGEQAVDILVFPEASLNYMGIESRENLSLVAVDLQMDIPDLVDCEYSHDSLLSALSAAALNASQMYILVNLVEVENCNETENCPSDGFHLYNTNIVFDKNGCIISRYRKINLFIEPNMDVMDEPELAVFETDFGVKFGHFICFDIMFKTPAKEILKQNVSHILYPSMWFSGTPFIISVQVQQSYSMGNNIVLLSAGGNMPSKSITGSGIFVGKKHGGIDVFISCKNESRMIVAEVPKNVDDEEYVPSPPTVKAYSPVEMDSMFFNAYPIGTTYPLQKHFTAHKDGVDCEFKVDYTMLDIPDGHFGYEYQFEVFSGLSNYVNLAQGGEIHCAITFCIHNDTCGHRASSSKNLVPSVKFHSIDIKASVHMKDDPDDYLMMPTSLDFSMIPLKPVNFEFKQEKDHEEIREVSLRTTTEVDNLMAFGIFGRNFNIDTKDFNIDLPEVTSSSEPLQQDEEINNSVENEDNDFTCKMIIYVCLMVVLGSFTAVMVYRKLKTPFNKSDPNKSRKSLN